MCAPLQSATVVESQCCGSMGLRPIGLFITHFSSTIASILKFKLYKPRLPFRLMHILT